MMFKKKELFNIFRHLTNRLTFGDGNSLILNISLTCLSTHCIVQSFKINNSCDVFNWYSPKKLKYGKPRLGESTLT